MCGDTRIPRDTCAGHTIPGDTHPCNTGHRYPALPDYGTCATMLVTHPCENKPTDWLFIQLYPEISLWYKDYVGYIQQLRNGIVEASVEVCAAKALAKA